MLQGLCDGSEIRSVLASLRRKGAVYLPQGGPLLRCICIDKIDLHSIHRIRGRLWFLFCTFFTCLIPPIVLCIRTEPPPSSQQSRYHRPGCVLTPNLPHRPLLHLSGDSFSGVAVARAPEALLFRRWGVCSCSSLSWPLRLGQLMWGRPKAGSLQSVDVFICFVCT